jgi:hypothetical protein
VEHDAKNVAAIAKNRKKVGYVGKTFIRNINTADFLRKDTKKLAVKACKQRVFCIFVE